MRKAVLLTKRQLAKLATDLPHWRLKKQDTVLERTITLLHYHDGITLIARLSIHAMVEGHYPELTYTKDKLVIRITGAKSQGLSPIDVSLAQRIDKSLKARDIV